MAENTNILETVTAWANITNQIWEDKMVKLGLYSKGSDEDGYQHLLDSLTKHIEESAGKPVSVTFTFNYYGRFVDMGVGKGTMIGDVAENKTSRRLEGKQTGNRRRPKPWYASTMYAERIKLIELLAEKYAHRAAITIVENIDDNAERYNGKII